MRKYHYPSSTIDLDLFLVNRFDRILDRVWWGRFIRTDSHFGEVGFHVQLFGRRLLSFTATHWESEGLSNEIACVLRLTKSPLSAIREFMDQELIELMDPLD